MKLSLIRSILLTMISRRNLIKSFVRMFFIPLFSSLPNRVNNALGFASSQENRYYSPFPPHARVLEIHNEEATSWDYTTERYLDYIHQDVVDDMVDEGVCELTGVDSPEAAWRNIMSGYIEGDKIAIKPNFNNINHGYQECVTSPQVINSVVKGLVDHLNVPEDKIYVYDLCKKIPTELVRHRINYKVNYIERLDINKFKDKVKLWLGLDLSCANKSEAIKTRNRIVNPNGNELTCYMPKVLTEANHLINISLLTNHIYMLASGPLKNHFGTVRFSNGAQYPGCLHGDKIEEHIVDINLNPHIKDKTRLHICDALFGVYARGKKSGVHKWKTFCCENGTPNSLFFSVDPLLMEQKMAGVVIQERKYQGYKILPHNYLSDYKSQMSKLSANNYYRNLKTEKIPLFPL